MKKTVTVEQVMNAYGVLSNAKFDKLDADGQVKALKCLKELRKTADGYREFVKDCNEKKKAGSISDEALYKAVAEENERRIEVSLQPFTEEEVKKIWQANALTGREMLALDDVVVSKD